MQKVEYTPVVSGTLHMFQEITISFFFCKDTLHRSKMVQLADLFSVPEMALLCNVMEYFLQNHIDYHPEILFRDVKVIVNLT